MCRQAMISSECYTLAGVHTLTVVAVGECDWHSGWQEATHFTSFVPFKLCIMCMYYFFKNNLNQIVTWVQTNQATKHVQPMPVGHQVSCEEAEALGSEVSRKEEEVQREGAPRAWVPPHRTGGTPDGQASLDFWVCAPQWACGWFPHRAARGALTKSPDNNSKG